MGQTIILPKLTEKTIDLARAKNYYTFYARGEQKLRKGQIKTFVEEQFEVKVADVKSQNRVGKMKRLSFRYRKFRRQPEQIFLVKLAKDDKIEGYYED
ncbi:MAG: 50S ribosomal protein L23 [Candidatus Dojkabacteria bacterium]